MGKIYTKGGDTGTTSLLGGQRVSKSHHFLNAYGATDTLNSAIGFLNAQLSEEIIKYAEHNPNLEQNVFWSQDDLKNQQKLLLVFQSELFTLGSLIASLPEDRQKFHLPDLDFSVPSQIEREIDSIWEKLPPLKNFILPGGSPISAWAHMCRVYCRDLERIFVKFLQDEEDDIPNAVAFINRMSDYFFTLARFLTPQGREKIWKPKEKE
jgi:cob(I)alamin adenosyltransferase